MRFLAEVIFFSGQRKRLPANGYRPDAVLDGSSNYWGITFIDLPIAQFDVPTLAAFKFSFQECHQQGVVLGQSFQIMEGPHQVGAGKIIAIEEDDDTNGANESDTQSASAK